nr:uncharacterized protein LOC129155120 isoform X1 [Nothobranchius furzeri]XP_054591300.1 uncharacterized protein LOC129155133 isoform X1 [Nothobranchius furzeri]XP_054591301.1 uncharacterized protein LOC129155133 isoform X1 [Nothobranchius furzeri]XP_054591321.1 uncharacterized protein LOC129155141 isoform X1 [Nothobranchius furzeri]XP_054591322.1 uncharacterized protein LOC129155141 isoform X1 [Nothobranchius furzeri]XP_054591360.1 uncharacterized protein LOC129155163 isoform X1 [Nothobranch
MTSVRGQNRMGYVCFKCHRSLGHNIRAFFNHLRVVHHILSTSTYFQCAQVGCHRTFDQIRSFRRHIIGHAIEFDIETEESSTGELPDSSVDPHLSVLNEVECCETTAEHWDELEEDNIKDRVALFLARLKATSSQTFSGIRDVVENTSGLIRDVVGCLKRKTLSFLREIGHSETPQAEDLMEQFTKAAEPFQGFESEYKQMKYFTQSGFFIQPEAVPLPGFSFTQEIDRESGNVKQVAVRDTFQYVPLKPMLKLVLESPGTIDKIFEWQNLENAALEDFRDGTIFETNPLFSKDFSIPLVLYSDECEMVNPLGAKTSVHKLGFIYFTMKCLPQEYMSSLKSHFLLAVYKADDVKTYGMNTILEPIVNDIKDMELNGFHVETTRFSGIVKAGVAQVCGDNLGLNGILGYTESFAGNSVCRWCRVHKEVLRVQTVEAPSSIRDKVNYHSDLLLHKPAETGIKRECSLNKLQFYHVTDNVAPDVMHDILEGIGGYEIKLVLNALIEQKIVTLDQLNYRLTSFDYGFCDVHNKPSTIKPQDLKNPDTGLRQSASQTWCLLRLLPLMIGDLIPEDNKYWELLLLLLSCMEFIFSPSLTEGAVVFLGHIIEKHHCLYLELFPDRHLKPKHHFMLHYPRAIRKLGPVVHFWSMRFEAKHGFFKRVSHVTCNFRNICKTQAYRHQIMMCYTLLSGQMFCHEFEVGPGYTKLLGTIEDFEKVKSGFEGVAVITDVYLPSWIKYKGTSYRTGMTLFMSHTDDCEPQFGTIQSIVVLRSNTKLILKKWETIGFERHFFCLQCFPYLSD